MRRLNIKYLIILFILFLTSGKLFASRLTGLITDNKNEPLSFAIVYINGTSTGTTANLEGKYSLELNPGTYQISFRLIGFSLITKSVIIGAADLELNVQMFDENVNLKEVTIRSDAEDPAYAIIRKAQKKRKYYRDLVDSYSANAYVKSTQQLISYPKKFLGQDVDLTTVVDTVTNIFYLSESVSKLFFNAPSEFKEKLISSKVSGSPKSYSFNQATDVLISFYNNLVNLGGLTPRGIVSPIAGNSIFYYKFSLEGTFVENGVLVNKISVTPRRNSDPVFTGTIYITEDTWRIYSTDLFITGNQQMEFVDTFNIRQNYLHVKDDIWMPFSHQFNYNFNAFGFKGKGVVLGVFSDYLLGDQVEKITLRRGEIMKVDQSANEKDFSYWNKIRPVPLSDVEKTDYHRKDSTRIVYQSKSYLDSVDRKPNKFTAGSLVSGYSWRNSFGHKYVNFVSPLNRTFFNTVEGWNTSLQIKYEKLTDTDSRKFEMEPEIHYGFSSHAVNAFATMRYFNNPKNFSRIEISGGRAIVQLNAQNPVSAFINSLYSLYAEKNYMKLYRKDYLSASHRVEITNGLFIQYGGEYARRNPLSNTSDYKFHNTKSRDYSSNDPYHPLTDEINFPQHDAFVVSGNINYRPGQKYIDRPDSKMIVESEWPQISVYYKKGFVDVDYDYVEVSLSDEMNLGLFGNLEYTASYGDFLNSKIGFAPDLKHFNGNKTWFSDFRANDFKNLDYYTYSTTDPFVEVHAQENFGGFFLNKIPLIRKLKLTEVVSVNYLHTSSLNQYFEVGAGVEKLGFIRAEIFTSFSDSHRGSTGFLIGIKKTIGQ